jgi:hypothetical protein
MGDERLGGDRGIRTPDLPDEIGTLSRFEFSSLAT